MIYGFSHVHISEREGAHQSPCGYDDGAWEDCLPDSTVMWWRATGHPEVPATHLEGEELRCASGRAPTGGTNIGDMQKGIAARYKGTTGPALNGFGSLWTELIPGRAAAIQGSMGAFPAGSPWRRWDPAFAGTHSTFVARLDGGDRVWWDDPLAPVGTYSGEWMSRLDLQRFVNGMKNPQSLVGTIVPDAQEAGVFTPGRIVRQSWTANGTNGVLRAKPDRSLAPFATIPAGQTVVSDLEGVTDDGNEWRGIVWPVGNPTNTIGAYLLRTGPGVPRDHDFTAGTIINPTTPAKTVVTVNGKVVFEA